MSLRGARRPRRRRSGGSSAQRPGRGVGRAEEILLGEDGVVPLIPVYWETYPNLEALKIKDSFAINPLGQIDLSAVTLR